MSAVCMAKTLVLLEMMQGTAATVDQVLQVRASLWQADGIWNVANGAVQLPCKLSLTHPCPAPSVPCRRPA
jgi:hypothetical protein